MKNQRAFFGPGGNSRAFYDAGYKSTVDAPGWVASIGLDAYEYEAGSGLTASAGTLMLIGNKARETGIRMSLHAPYFISLSGVEEVKRLGSLRYISQSLNAAKLLGAYLIVVHTGSAAKISRAEAMRLASDTLFHLLDEIPDNGVLIGLETMGKINQLGTLDEVIELCKLSPRFVPVVDFGHMNARECGGVFQSASDYLRVFDTIGDKLGDEIARNLHCHFSKIEWSAGGEKRHLTFADTVYGPAFEPLMDAIANQGLTPTVISESDGTMSDDALTMKRYYEGRLTK
ncbi:MAG: TIM barrel protein [Clostridia bacterium]|nr:TIM barrel protein [Clostridia bacterium]